MADCRSSSGRAARPDGTAVIRHTLLVSTAAESPFMGKALRQGPCMIQMPAPLTYIPRRLAKPVLVCGSYPNRGGLRRVWARNDVGTIARHGEVAEWLKAAPC